MGFHPPAAIGRVVNAPRRVAPPPPAPHPAVPRRLEIFAVGTDWCQLTWSALGPGELEVTVDWADGGRTVAVHADGGPGGAEIDGLPHGTEVRVAVTGPDLDDSGVGGSVTLTARTLPRPAGTLLGRLATVSDAHLGSTSTGFFHTLIEIPEPDVPNTARCLAAAIAAIAAWGPDAVVVKGDLVDASTEDNWATAARLLTPLDAPTLIIPGNHEHSARAEVDPFDAAAAVGLDLVQGVAVHDLDAADGRVRVIAADVGRHGSDLGHLDPVADAIVDAAGSVDGASLIAIHQQPMRFRFPTYIPMGIPAPEGARLCRRLRAAAAHTVVTAGHTHRHRRRTMAGVTVAEVGSTRDFPGTWAGYEFYEGGVVQTVRRITDPSCIRWTDYTRRSALGLWGRWASGTVDDRCFTLDW